MSASYLRRNFELPAEVEEMFSALLWVEGCLGVEIRGEGAIRELSAFFPMGEAPPFDETRWRRAGVRLLAEFFEREADWHESYRKHAEPRVVGRLVLDPREPDSPPPALEPGQRWLRLPARSAFGTGSHASTRLALELLASIDVTGRRVLDVGTGTGVLALAARCAGSGPALAFDVDPAAAVLAGENARLNGIDGIRLFAGRLGGLSRRAGPFELVLVNVLPHLVEDELPGLAPLLAPGAILILSGSSVENAAIVRGRLKQHGWELLASRQDEEWIGFVLRWERPGG